MWGAQTQATPRTPRTRRPLCPEDLRAPTPATQVATLVRGLVGGYPLERLLGARIEVHRGPFRVALPYALRAVSLRRGGKPGGAAESRASPEAGNPADTPPHESTTRRAMRLYSRSIRAGEARASPARMRASKREWSQATLTSAP